MDLSISLDNGDEDNSSKKKGFLDGRNGNNVV
jgi:hypothetical protein